MTRFGSVSEVRTVSSRKPVCFRRIGRTLSLIAFAISWDFPGLLWTSTTRVNIGNSPFEGYGLKGTSRELRGAGCHPISGQNTTLLRSRRSRQEPRKCLCALPSKACGINWIGETKECAKAPQSAKSSFHFRLEEDGQTFSLFRGGGPPRSDGFGFNCPPVSGQPGGRGGVGTAPGVSFVGCS